MIEILPNGVRFESFASEEATQTEDEFECVQALVNKHGLEGQRTLAKTRCPFRQITQEEAAVFRELCPNETPVEKYDGEPIPLRVLELLDRAKDTGMFRFFTVWHPAPGMNDPILVARTHENQFAIGNQVYLIARWGAHLDEWPAMVKAAIASRTARLKALAAKIDAEVRIVQDGNAATLARSFTHYSA